MTPFQEAILNVRRAKENVRNIMKAITDKNKRNKLNKRLKQLDEHDFFLVFQSIRSGFDYNFFCLEILDRTDEGYEIKLYQFPDDCDIKYADKSPDEWLGFVQIKIRPIFVHRCDIKNESDYLVHSILLLNDVNRWTLYPVH